MAARGALVVLEGIDGSGKSTQLAALAAHYRAAGRNVSTFREPGDSDAGRRLRELTKAGRADAETEHALFMEDRREDVAKNLRPALDAGHLVLLDRYYVSNMAYQGARGLDPERIRTENEAFAPRPDVCIVLDLRVDRALQRASDRGARDGFEEQGNLEAVRDLYRSFADRFDWVIRVDADKGASDLTAALVAVIDRVLIHHS